MADTAVAPPPASTAPPVPSFDNSVGMSSDLTNNAEFQADFDNPGIQQPPVFPDQGIQAEPPKVEAPAAEVPSPETPVEEPPEEQPVEGAPAEKGAVAAPPDEEFPIPDDVRVETTRENTKQYVMPETRFNEYHNSLRTIRDAEASLGEPLTAELIKDMADARIGMQNLESRFISPRIEAHREILEQLATDSDEAFRRGDTKYNSLATLASAMPEFLATRNPMAYNLQAQAYLQREGPNYFNRQAPGFFKNMLYGLAGSLQNQPDDVSKSRYASVQHIANMMFGEYPDPTAPDGVRRTGGPAFNPFQQQSAAPPSATQQEREQIARERQAWQQEQNERAEASWRDQISSHDEGVKKDLSKVVADVLKPVADKYSKIPKALDGVKTQFLQLVNDGIAKSDMFRQVRQNLLEEARAASSETRRNEILATLKQRYTAFAKTVLDPIRNKEVREVLSQKAQQIVADNQAQVQRARAAGSQRQPSAGGASPNRGILPPPAQVPEGLKTADEIRALIMAE